MSFTDQQIEQLLKPIHPSRVVKDPKGMSYIEQHDVRAHLTRIFGFGEWNHDLTRLELVFEEPTKSIDKQTGKPKPDRWDVCYKASVRLTVQLTCGYEDAATGFAQNQTRGEAHDLALKSAVSTALKRAATSLGDQFGLSLYAGTTNALVPNCGRSHDSNGASNVSVSAPAPSSSAVTAKASPWSTMRLLSELNSATNKADNAPAAMPIRIDAGTPPTTSATPGITAMPRASSRSETRRPVSRGSIRAVSGVASAMQVAPTEAFASLIAP